MTIEAKNLDLLGRLTEHSTIPKWRHAVNRIRIFEGVGIAWFCALPEALARFAVRLDGRVFWGDGFEVVHGDFGPALSSLEIPPLLIVQGVLLCVDGQMRKQGGLWCLASVETYLGRGEMEAAAAERLINQLPEWRACTEGLRRGERFR